mmetsp:Transcript_24839/g.36459  ORF Transcript_24839/g.36459 Transcript_24839/m.36459 type:complete len:81 (+) Transcript_24839:15-257(+)
MCLCVCVCVRTGVYGDETGYISSRIYPHRREEKKGVGVQQPLVVSWYDGVEEVSLHVGGVTGAGVAGAGVLVEKVGGNCA